MIGVSISFYGVFGKKTLEGVKNLINIFEDLKLPPFIQLISLCEGESLEKLASELSKLKERFGIKYSIHQLMGVPFPGFYLNLASGNEKIKKSAIETTRKMIDFARIIKAANVSFHGGYAANIVSQKKEYGILDIAEPISYQEAYNNVKENFKILSDYNKGEIGLSIENLNYRPKKRYLFSRPEDFKHLPEGVEVLFDMAHAYYSQNKIKNPAYIKEMIDVVGGRITEIHVSDNDGTEDQHKLPGLGNIHFSEIFHQISEKQKMPPIIIESSQARHNYSEEDLKKSIKFIQSICPK